MDDGLRSCTEKRDRWERIKAKKETGKLFEVEGRGCGIFIDIAPTFCLLLGL